MSVAPLKVALVIAGVSGLGLGSYGIYHLTSEKETIGARITSDLEGSKKRFLGKGDVEWSKLKDKYNSLSNKPKSKDGSTDLSFSKLPNWCDLNYRERYSESKRDLYDKVLTFCFFNTNTIFSELEGKSLVSGEKGSSEWQSAWTTYNSQKNSKQLVISGSTDDSKLNGSNKDEGTPILYEWCTTTGKKKMYSVDIDTIFPRFKSWCIS